MIDEIRVKNIALIREARMVPSEGLTVLTGETGAGKTALLSACKLLMGERADKSTVREGESEALVEGRFFLAHVEDAQDGDENGSEAGGDEQGAGACEAVEDEIVVSRRLSADGRSRVQVNGGMSSVSQLSRIVAPHVDLCGQHEHQTLLKPAAHEALLDAWAADEVGVPRDAYAAAFRAAQAARAEYDRVREARSASEAALDEARFVLRQIDSVGVSQEDYDDLTAYLDKAEHAEALARAANGAYEGLAGAQGAALDDLNAAIAALDEGARFDGDLAVLAQSLREAGFIMEDVAREVLSYRDSIEYDPAELANAQERAAAMQGLMRTYGPRIEDVIARRDEAADLVSMVDDAEEREACAKRALDEAEARLADAAEALRSARAAAAPRFSACVSEVMARLEMGTAELVCRVDLLDRAQWRAAGPTSCEFFFRPGSGMQPRPLARIASGGEISRVMLAVHVVMGERDRVDTIVFDEVDSGVGGATALALAQVIADLATTHQVLVITHLPQVAVAADTHYVVRKTSGAMPETDLSQVEGEDRVAEIARMLSGDASGTSLAHAREMLEAAQAR